MKKSNLNTLFLMLFMVFFTVNGQVNNPIVPDVGMADPHIYVYDNIAYLYSTRDDNKTSKTWNMPDWKIWSSSDLINWKLERTILPEETYIGKPSKGCWASDVASKNDKYYFYFSNRNLNTGVLVADHPSGPFKDVLGKPLLGKDLTTNHEYDPSAFVDDDKEKSAYITFGGNNKKKTPVKNYFIVKLGEDMMSLVEKPRELIINGAFHPNDKSTLHKRDGIYYLSAGTKYATSKNVYGPYTSKGTSSPKDIYGLNQRAHGNYFEWNKQWFHTWCDMVNRSIGRYREARMTYMHYKDNGDMVDDVVLLEKHYKTGVGQYDASWDKIEAEWYMAAKNVMKRENTTGGFEIQRINNGGSLYFPNVRNIKENATISFHVSSELSGGTIEIYEDSIDGELLGCCNISKTKSFKKYKKMSCKLKNKAGDKNIYLVFKSKKSSENLFNLDWFSFNKE